MKSLIFFSFLLYSATTSCTYTTDPSIIKKTYEEEKSAIATQKNLLLNLYNSANDSTKTLVLNQTGAYLDSAITKGLFPHWKGTPWEFNGHTNTPNEGEIACGYLVSTLLKHAGFKINRYKMAQQSSLSEIKTLSKSTYLGDHYKDALKKLESYDDGLYILGLSYHVGLIHVHDGQVHFLHSTYLDPTAVVNEKAEISEAFMYSSVYYIGSITTNNKLMKKWLDSTTIDIHMD